MMVKFLFFFIKIGEKMIKNLSLKPRDILYNKKIDFIVLILFITIAHFNIEIEQNIKKIKKED